MLRQHLMKVHVAAADHHTRMAKAHMAAASAHDCLDEDTQKIAGGRYHKDLAEAHRRMAEAHGDHAEEHIGLYKSLEARGDEGLPHVSRETETHGDSFGSHDFRAAAGTPWERAQALDKIVPDGVRGVLLDVPRGTLVPRFGGPDIQTEQIDPQLRKLVESD
jgi:hypothetical protein